MLQQSDRMWLWLRARPLLLLNLFEVSFYVSTSLFRALPRARLCAALRTLSIVVYVQPFRAFAAFPVLIISLGTISGMTGVDGYNEVANGHRVVPSWEGR